MNLLALETATPMCSVALSVSGQIAARSELAARGHALRLLPWCEELLAEGGLEFSDLDGLVVGRGPGGFTSLRIGLAVAQGVALAHALPIYPVSSLAALALAADPRADHQRILALIDARMGEVFAGWFERRDGLLHPLKPEAVLAPADVLLPDNQRWLIAGSGLAAYLDTLSERLDAVGHDFRPDAWPQAEQLFGWVDRVEPLPAWELEPTYVRNRVTQ